MQILMEYVLISKVVKTNLRSERQEVKGVAIVITKVCKPFIEVINKWKDVILKGDIKEKNFIEEGHTIKKGDQLGE